MKVGLVSLGCARTLVDSEVALGELLKNGYTYAPDARQADVAIVNTCGFTESAKQESIDVILELADLKHRNKIKALVIMGCLSQRYGPELQKEIEEADAIIGTNSYADLARLLEPLKRREKVLEVEPRPRFLLNHDHARKRLTPLYTAYVKISEGCINACSYCAIPRMKGPHRSRAISDIAQEVKKLMNEHPLSEINLIGQDTAAYGVDIDGRFMLADLLNELSALAPQAWIRPLYAHPAHVTPELVEVFRRRPNVCRYVDLPIEHSHPDTLRRMNRGCTRKEMDSVIASLRSVPGMVLRTAVIVGFPGETENEFRDLLDYMEAVRFERLGAFEFSREDGTRAYSMEGQVSEETKKERFARVMNLQKSITADWGASRIGKTLKVLVEEKTAEPGVYAGRSEADAPEVDGQVYIHAGGRELRPGRFAQVEITDSTDHDLVGEVRPGLDGGIQSAARRAATGSSRP